MTNTDLLRHVHRAGKELVLRDLPLRKRLILASQEFNDALWEPDGWPPKLFERAEKLADDIHENRDRIVSRRGLGVVKLTNSLAREMFEIVCDVERAIGMEFAQSSLDDASQTTA